MSAKTIYYSIVSFVGEIIIECLMLKVRAKKVFNCSLKYESWSLGVDPPTLDDFCNCFSKNNVLLGIL